VQPASTRAVAKPSATIKALLITHSSRTFKPRLNFLEWQRKTQRVPILSKKRPSYEMAKNPQNLAGQRVFFCKISGGNLHCQEFASFKSTNFLRKVGQSGICELAVFDLILQLSVFLRD
jgi:hypothetical protein